MHSRVFLCVLSVAFLASFAQGCEDRRRECSGWARRGFCSGKYEQYMKRNCQKSCKFCGGGGGGGGGGGDGGGGGGNGQCGYKPSVRIVGGSEAPRGAWPWQAQVRSSNGFTFCGGTLVHPRWIVTAAHCVPNKPPSSIRVRLGAHYRSRKTGSEQDFEVERIISHRSYKRPYGMAHDIAMLKLRRPAQINRNVNLACLPGSSGEAQVGKTCWVTGYGTLSSGGSLADRLMQVDVPIVSQSQCKQGYGSSIHESMVCAGFRQGGKDSCQGDSGGPLVCEMSGKYYLEGVVSWGHGCAARGKYGVYARVRYLRQWIDDTMGRY